MIVNFFLPHGWVVWPAVLAIGIMVMMNEAAQRNTQGVPPLVVYGWFSAALLVWVAVAFLFSAIAQPLLTVGLPVGIVFGIITYRKNKKRNQLIDERRAKGLCAYCGEPVIAEMGACGNCGREFFVELSFMERLRSSNRSAEANARTREVLLAPPPTVAAKRKEQALIARRHKQMPKQTPPGS